MSASPTSEPSGGAWPVSLASASEGARAAGRVLRLPFRGHLWRGRAGAWLGAGRGASLEFQDHRVYVPGDDPRHINWQAYARTGVYSMKLYREEVNPSVDVVFDRTASMALDEAKARRTLELLLFAAASGREAGASVRGWTLAGGAAAPIEVDALTAGAVTLTTAPNPLPLDLSSVPLRAGSLRVLITDGLFEAPPDHVLSRLAAGGGHAVVFLVFSEAESRPDWSGAIELEECETGALRDQQIAPDAYDRYLEAYRRHFASWQDAGRRFGAATARVPSEPTLVEALRLEALATAAVEPV